MVNSDKSIFEYEISPFIQGAVVLGAILLFTLVTLIFGKLGLAETDEGTPWLVACSMTFFFAIGNSVLSLAADDQNKYWWQSILSFVLLAIIGGGMAYLFSGVTIGEVDSYKWLYVVFTFGHILFLAIVRTMKRIVLLAKEQDSRLRGED
ncbi:MAG: hypothetical protein P1U56_08460 [Saprospiraceae bacterium]|nr:hypothetical protein [Saprospiraceae bacterium]